MDKTDTIHRAIESLQRLSDLFHKRRIQLATAANLTEQQWLVLEQISQTHFMPSMFAKERQSSSAAVSKIIRQLADKKLISVSIKQGDSRLREYRLTSYGEKALNIIRNEREMAIKDIWLDFSENDLNRFAHISDMLADSIDNYLQKSNIRTGETK
jgi:DNA-binding MarR family transcriptional regulator